MPLQIKKGVLLDPYTAVEPPEIDFKVQEGGPPDRQIEPIILNVKRELQEGKLWCWAACIHMVRAYYEKGRMSQCQIVQTKLDGDGEGLSADCSADFDDKEEDCDPTRIAQTWRDCGIKGVVPMDGPLSFADIKAELSAGRPVEAGILWNPGGGGHVVIIKGWANTSPQSLVINDPLRRPILAGQDGSGRATFDELAAAFGRGDWVYTWTNLV